ncbi:PspC domain-containing protein [Colwellia hornerae]|uniref:PspC domain-containing protein n=1 Tax=Colwellia hornerae TaxID=89402 RepID=A0A5C6QFY8_9GAMM|nr:PspC domain-containing protein [Colwellia hornerae]TWX55245.1 PspC domain-containing protein [Colwellia hornerae]TWX61245.1 PspC domain-containing protein [Colwellia hornerae]TWX67708.1 PspC domain-containing protein [Colwellia hornerae]
MSYQREYSVKKTLTKDVTHKKLSGVCAGIAKYYDLPRIAIRIGAIGALLIFPLATGVAYVVAAILLPTKH